MCSGGNGPLAKHVVPLKAPQVLRSLRIDRIGQWAGGSLDALEVYNYHSRAFKNLEGLGDVSSREAGSTLDLNAH